MACVPSRLGAAVRRFSSKAEHFPGISKIKYEGATSTNPLSFRHYNADEVVLGRKMRDWTRFAVWCVSAAVR